jgi:hypothetical protein
MNGVDTCFMITVSVFDDSRWSTHIDSIWLDQSGSYGRAMELAREFDAGEEEITSYKNIPYAWCWKTDDGLHRVEAELLRIGQPMLRWIDWMHHEDDNNNESVEDTE